MSGINARGTERSYSPVYRARGLADDAPDEEYAERIAEMGLEMDMALEYMGDVGKFLTEKEDIQILEYCEEATAIMIDNHIDTVEKLN